jgi:hypothetical protein
LITHNSIEKTPGGQIDSIADQDNEIEKFRD